MDKPWPTTLSTQLEMIQLEMVYTDGGSGIIRACTLLGLNYVLSTPEVHETNATAERYVQYVQEGMRVLLGHDGIPAP